MKIEATREAFFPDMLKNLPIWVLWRLEERNGNKTKVPYQVNGRKASSTNPGQWTTYEEASATLARYPDHYSGLGTVMAKKNGLIFIDIDHCLDADGNTDHCADDILDAFTDDDGGLTQYIELSQSGTGLHIIAIGDIPRSFKNSKKHVEMYSDSRFCAMTGRAISAREPSECDIGIRYVFEKYKTKSAEDAPPPRVDPQIVKSDRWIIEHASARTESKFPALWAGDWSGAGYGSHSEADLALCKILAFWTNNDPVAIDRLFRQSGLYRAKWERENYSQTTIQKAIATNNDTLYEYTQRMKEQQHEADLEGLRELQAQLDSKRAESVELEDGKTVHTVPAAEVGKDGAKKNPFEVCDYSDVKIKDIQFLFFPWFPRGKITIIQGDSSSGKSTFMYGVGAAVTVNNNILTVPCENPGNVMFLTNEDDDGEIKTAVIDAGGDWKRMKRVKDREQIAKLNLSPGGVEALKDVIRKYDIVLLVLDPLQAFLTGDINKSTETRPQLVRLAVMAEELNITVVIIQHTGKDQTKKALHKGIGSVDIGAASRSLLQVVTDPEDDEYRIMFTVKNNLAPFRDVKQAIRYRIEDSPLAAIPSNKRRHYRGHAEFVELIPNYDEKKYNKALLNSEQSKLEESINLETDPLAFTILRLAEYNPHGCFLCYDDLSNVVIDAAGHCPYTRDQDKTTGFNSVIKKIRDPMLTKYHIQLDITSFKLRTECNWKGDIITSDTKGRGLKIHPINQIIDGEEQVIIELPEK